MSRIRKHIAGVIFAVLLAACLTAAYMGGAAARKPLVCTGLSIEVADSAANRFVTAADVKKYLDKEYPEYMGMPLCSLDLAEIERIVDGKSAVKKSQAYTARDGKLHVSVTQREPVVRFQKGQQGIYADSRGFLFPLQSSYASHVQIVDGDIPLNISGNFKGTPQTEEEQLWLKRMTELVNFMEDSRLWKDKIVQITVDRNGDLTLIPRKGNERFLFGSPTEIKEKFSKMELYYRGIADKTEGGYRSVDLRFADQIVCRHDNRNK